MTDEIIGCYQEYRPTRWERFWKDLGYHYHMHDDVPQEVQNMPGWIKTHWRIDMGISDRLRFLLTGKLRVDLTTYADTKVDHAVTFTNWRISYPRERD